MKDADYRQRDQQVTKGNKQLSRIVLGWRECIVGGAFFTKTAKNRYQKQDICI